jgi:hypothetical protein
LKTVFSPILVIISGALAIAIPKLLHATWYALVPGSVVFLLGIIMAESAFFGKTTTSQKSMGSADDEHLGPGLDGGE